jgi:hypothetical protein
MTGLPSLPRLSSARMALGPTQNQARRNERHGKKPMPQERGVRVPKSPKPRADVFLNVPCDKHFQKPCLAYISGISAFGLVPRATLEIPANTRRLDRVLKLIRGCQYSVHDLSRVELDAKRPPTPRFNMPFEQGLCVAWARGVCAD